MNSHTSDTVQLTICGGSSAAAASRAVTLEGTQLLAAPVSIGWGFSILGVHSTPSLAVLVNSAFGLTNVGIEATSEFCSLSDDFLCRAQFGEQKRFFFSLDLCSALPQFSHSIISAGRQLLDA